MAESKLMLSCCLYFTAGNLARAMNDMANTCFQPTGLNPSQGFALLCVIDEPEIQPSVIAERLGLAPSTITRVIDALRNKGLVEAESGGRTSLISPTKLGIDCRCRIFEQGAVSRDGKNDNYAWPGGDWPQGPLLVCIHRTRTDLRAKPLELPLVTERWRGGSCPGGLLTGV